MQVCCCSFVLTDKERARNLVFRLPDRHHNHSDGNCNFTPGFQRPIVLPACDAQKTKHCVTVVHSPLGYHEEVVGTAAFGWWQMTSRSVIDQMRKGDLKHPMTTKAKLETPLVGALYKDLRKFMRVLMTFTECHAITIRTNSRIRKPLAMHSAKASPTNGC